MGLAFFHTHIHGIDRFFPPQKERYVSFFRVILRNFHESNRFFPFPLLFCLLRRSVIKREYFAIVSAIFRIIRLEERRERRTVSPVPLSRRVISEKRERGKRKSIRKKGRRRARRRRLRPVWKRAALRAPINRSSWKQILRYRPCVTGSSFHF